VKAPEQYLNELGLTVPAAVDSTRPAVLDEAHRIRINYETYFTADLDGRKQFLADPIRYCGPVTDPVSKDRFRPNRSSPRFDYDGVVYYFLDSEDMARFAAAPDSFTAPSFLMTGGHKRYGPGVKKS